MGEPFAEFTNRQYVAAGIVILKCKVGWQIWRPALCIHGNPLDDDLLAWPRLESYAIGREALRKGSRHEPRIDQRRLAGARRTVHQDTAIHRDLAQQPVGFFVPRKEDGMVGIVERLDAG